MDQPPGSPGESPFANVPFQQFFPQPITTPLPPSPERTFLPSQFAPAAPPRQPTQYFVPPFAAAPAGPRFPRSVTRNYPMVRTADLPDETKELIRKWARARNFQDLPDEVPMTPEIKHIIDTQALQRKIDQFGFREHLKEYNGFFAVYRDELVTEPGDWELSTPQYLLDPGEALYPGVWIKSTFQWRGPFSGKVALAVNDREIRGFIMPQVDALKRGSREFLVVTAGDDQNNSNHISIVYDNDHFEISYGNEGIIEIYGDGAQAILDWMDHFSTYFRGASKMI